MTALLKVKKYLLLNMFKGQISLLFMLDLSTAFDTLDHSIQHGRLQSKLGLRGNYAGETQLSANSSEAEAVTAIENCVHKVRAWWGMSWQSFNDQNPEFLIIGMERQFSKVSVVKIIVGQAVITPVSSVRSMGAWIDSHLDMFTHVNKACIAFYYLYNIRKYLPQKYK